MCLFVCMYACTHVCMWVCIDSLCGCVWMHVCMWVCMHVYTYTCMSVGIYVCMHACGYAFIAVGMYVYMHVCGHICIMHVGMYVCIYACTWVCILHVGMYACMWVGAYACRRLWRSKCWGTKLGSSGGVASMFYLWVWPYVPPSKPCSNVPSNDLTWSHGNANSLSLNTSFPSIVSSCHSPSSELHT